MESYKMQKEKERKGWFKQPHNHRVDDIVFEKEKEVTIKDLETSLDNAQWLEKRFGDCTLSRVARSQYENKKLSLKV